MREIYVWARDVIVGNGRVMGFGGEEEYRDLWSCRVKM